MADRTNPAAWKIVVNGDRRAILQIADGDGPREEDLGPLDAVCEALTEFLSEQDFGEATVQ